MKEKFIFVGMVILSLAIVYSTSKLSDEISRMSFTSDSINNNMGGSINNSMSMEASSEGYVFNSGILNINEACNLLGYSNSTEPEVAGENLINDIENGVLKGIPYTKIGSNYIFSQKALNEWMYERCNK